MNRHDLFGQIPYFWPDLNDEEYALYDCLVYTQDEVDRIREATRAVDAIFRKANRLLRTLPDETLRLLGYPEASLPFLRDKALPQETIIGRYDWIVKDGVIKLMEFNADTPTFIKELFDVNRYVTTAFGLNDPNANATAELKTELRKAVIAAWQRLNRDGTPKIVFTSHDDNIEDKWTTRFLQETLDLPSEFVSLDRLLVDVDGVYTPSGERVDVLYRQTYPIEHLVDDRAPNGDLIGIRLLELNQAKHVSLLNPLSAFLMQSKGVQALIWELYETDTYFDTEERQVIRTHLLPTYLEADPFLGQSAYVQKPAFGREGDSVILYAEDGVPFHKEVLQTYAAETAVYQQFIELPTRTTNTVNGPLATHYMIGCFCLNGHPSALGARAGSMITNNQSYYLAIGTPTHEGD
ncbi:MULTISPECIES: glutathionylspermidine synthase family protein [unclassified Exiguobacterium]|uniref:glutathionylspermidine synthase family protein n=1 Tax=unclassified Exiguobacterium TaxID=2644629 RepID=UPI00103B25B7|nr:MULTISPECIES: glutathionylspermidine synthase family protein [unclassified Exiguobacterium]TCI48469.1 glutathionylspermidine synthase family protein [Exiguobacterium sp. SH5S32]TCI55356.1 glutathionylspermidine synthase family protein [Exiguobacterium sp. SH1S4]TCI75150.1 glutathionylspermidine synthase family protein [Exiguobacterium sp. SH1S1]